MPPAPVRDVAARVRRCSAMLGPPVRRPRRGARRTLPVPHVRVFRMVLAYFEPQFFNPPLQPRSPRSGFPPHRSTDARDETPGARVPPRDTTPKGGSLLRYTLGLHRRLSKRARLTSHKRAPGHTCEVSIGNRDQGSDQGAIERRGSHVASIHELKDSPPSRMRAAPYF